MAHNNFTPINVGAAANAETFNAPMEQLSDALDAKESRLAAAEGSIQDLQTQQTADEAAVSALAERMTDAEDDLETKATKAPRYVNGVPTGQNDNSAAAAYAADALWCETPATTSQKRITLGDIVVRDGTTIKVVFFYGISTNSFSFVDENNNSYTVSQSENLKGVGAGELVEFVYTGGTFLIVSVYTYKQVKALATRLDTAENDIDAVETALNGKATKESRYLNGMSTGAGGDDSTWYNTDYVVCNTAAATAAKSGAVTGDKWLLKGTTLKIRFAYGNTASGATFTASNNDEITAVPLNGLPTDLAAGTVIHFVYDDTLQAFVIVGGASSGGGGSYTLPPATANTLGGVKVGTNLSIDQNGVLSATDTTYGEATSQTAGLMPAADKSKLDGVEAGANAYVLPTAAAQTLGGVKVGSGLSIDQDGVLSASGGGGGGSSPYYFAISDTAESTQIKTATITGLTEYTDGLIVDLFLSKGNRHATFKVNFNNLGAVTVATAGASLSYNTIRAMVYRLIYYNGFFYLSDGGEIALMAQKLSNSIYCDGVSTDGSGSVTHTSVCNSAANETIKEADVVPTSKPTYNYLIGTYHRILLTLGNTAKTMKICKTGYRSIAAYTHDVYNSEGGTEMPYIPAGGWMEIIYNNSAGYYQLVNWTGKNQVEATSETDTALDDLTLNGDYLVIISNINHKLTNIYNAEDLHEQYLFSRPAAITPGSTAAPVRKYRCREWDSTNSVWLGWTEWTTL